MALSPARLGASAKQCETERPQPHASKHSPSERGLRANGHLLVALGEPRPTLMDYDPPQRAALWALVDLASELMQSALNPQGINIGVNQGRAAGAGVPQHLHAHLVPRWSGDVNFMAVVGQVRVIPAALEHMARRYRQTWALMRSRGAG